MLADMTAVLRSGCLGEVVVADGVSHGNGCPFLNMLCFELVLYWKPDNLSALSLAQETELIC